MATPKSWMKLREYALTLPEAYEDNPWEEVVVKVRKKIFVFFGREESPGLGVKVTDPMTHRHALSLKGAEPSGYGLARSGWVSIPLKGNASALDFLKELIEESYRAVAPKSVVAKLDAKVVG
jgi:predicted DNA-binding protein (MmcQ/YjbR family)